MNTTISMSDLDAARLALWRLSMEVSTQLDLCYDDSEFPQMEHAFETLALADEAMKKLGSTPPPTIERMRARFERSKDKRMGRHHYCITISEIVEVQDEAALIEEFRRFRNENFYAPNSDAFRAETERVITQGDFRVMIESLAEIGIRPGWSPLQGTIEVEALPEYGASGASD